ncbi:MAG TPA: outer membrane beta-barrel protein [Acidobacteriota bacterium]|nr:outer membrane beta-barrel protein [Acidobacteriota bacterium]
MYNLFLLLAVTLTGFVSAQEKPLTNEDIIQMLKSGVSEDIIIEKIAVSGCDCEKSAFDIMILNGAGASPRLVKFIINAEAPQAAAAPVAAAPEPTKVTLFGGYSYGRSEGDLGGFNWNGFNGAVTGHLTDWLAITGDVSGHYTDLSVLDVSVYSFAIGPEFTRRTGRVRGFGHVLFGASRISAGLLGVGVGETGFSTVIGGGVDVGVSEHFAIRVFQSDWLRIWDIGGDDFNLGRFSFGVVGRF